MRTTSLLGRIAVVMGFLGASYAARASVVLSLSPSQSVTAGGTVTVTVSLTSTSEHTVGLDYFLRSTTTGLFTITGRSLAGSPYSDPTNPDSTVLATPSAILNKTRNTTITGVNGSDLGATTTGAEEAAGTYPVATYTLSVSPSATNGVYNLATYSDPNDGYSGGASVNYASADFASQGSVTITVTPEPAALAGLALAAGWVLRRRRDA